ncbi:hypothetical protein SNOG_01215 [Parastagonospora nodorum SN15]|uniref:Uncharacterized protein n=1 Tax=Phaeosphaeria nodorum (strain SN15 / ATCC MYA-4574 / FGSC 10173) TaxID=321614 RepID=Q0V449_PHANO|nr:hypothetical protein SNOG_01215 [Parastagonospora nodorum SN15]EAT90864.1 hypothetical protein SNOG_01215 [Parastagonospora nodorum SN15]
MLGCCTYSKSCEIPCYALVCLVPIPSRGVIARLFQDDSGLPAT